MNRYFLFDAGCGSCSGIARQIAEEVGDTLTVRSLAELEMNQILDKALPGWKWEPTILEVDGENAQAYVGIFMRLRLIQLLGIRKAWRIARIVFQAVDGASFDIERRSFLRRGSQGIMAGLAVVGLQAFGVRFDQAAQTARDKVSHRMLSGGELAAVVNEAEASREFGKFSAYLSNEGFAQARGQASAILVESPGYTPVVVVTIPFVGPTGGADALIKYVRYGSKSQMGAGIFHYVNQQFSQGYVYEIVSNQVARTSTFTRRSDGWFEKQGWEESSTTKFPGVEDRDQGDVSLQANCAECKQVCTYIYGVGCSLSQLVMCGAACAAFTGPLIPICAAACTVLYAIICIWQTGWVCEDACKFTGHCT